MPIQVEQLPGEPIITATVINPFDARQDVPAMFAEFTRLRLALQGDVVLIIDLSGGRVAFSQTVAAMTEASSGIKASRAAGVDRPPIVIFVGTSVLVDLASRAMGKRQYGGVKGHQCATKDEAIALGREILSKKGQATA